MTDIDARIDHLEQRIEEHAAEIDANLSEIKISIAEVLACLEEKAKERQQWTPTNTNVEKIPHSQQGKAREQDSVNLTVVERMPVEP